MLQRLIQPEKSPLNLKEQQQSHTNLQRKTASCKLTVSGSVAKCIDVSTWQGSIDFNKVKSAGYDYVIIRAGYGKEKAKKTICLKQTTKRQNPPVLKSEHIGSAMQCHRQRQQQKQMLALVVSRVKSLNFLFTTIWNISLQ